MAWLLLAAHRRGWTSKQTPGWRAVTVTMILLWPITVAIGIGCALWAGRTRTTG